jgi:SpoVK/Ycf46/Vps4 family AAA+-type ATPase
MICLDEDINAEEINQSHLIKAMKLVKPIITKEMLEYYENFAKNKEIN